METFEPTMKPPAHLSMGDVIEHDGEAMIFNGVFQQNLSFIIDNNEQEENFLPEELPEQVEVLFNVNQ